MLLPEGLLIDTRLMSRAARLSALFACVSLTAVAGCSSGRGAAPGDVSPAALADVRAELRMVGSDSTWVVRGAGYELAARSRRDIAQLQPMLERQSAAFRAVFDVDPTFVQVAVDHYDPVADIRVSTPIIPAPGVPVVTIDVGSPAGRRDDGNTRRSQGAQERRGDGRGEGRGENQARAGGPLGAGFSPLRQLVRSWLSLRASTLTSHAIGISASSGESNDPRVAAWAESALIGMTADSALVIATEHLLIASSDSLYPLTDFFTMLRPPMVVGPVMADRGPVAAARQRAV